MTNILTDEEGTRFEVVEPGSAADPFSALAPAASPAVPASPAAPAPAVPPVAPASDGPQVQPAAAQPTSPAPGTPATPAAPATPAPTPEAKPEIDVSALVKDAVGTALRSQQSSYDKRMAALETQLNEAREASRKAERDAKLSNPELDESEKEILRNKYALEDERAKLDTYADELDAYHRTIFIGALLQESGAFGVTAEELEAFQEPEEMTAYVKDKELAFYKSGAHVTPQVPTSTVETVPAGVPAGAQAPSDVGGLGAPPAPAPKWDDGQGPDSLARNLNSLPWETIPIN